MKCNFDEIVDRYHMNAHNTDGITAYNIHQ